MGGESLGRGPYLVTAKILKVSVSMHESRRTNVGRLQMRAPSAFDRRRGHDIRQNAYRSSFVSGKLRTGGPSFHFQMDRGRITLRPNESWGKQRCHARTEGV